MTTGSTIFLRFILTQQVDQIERIYLSAAKPIQTQDIPRDTRRPRAAGEGEITFSRGRVSGPG
jgi:hypothetical protein